MLKKARFDFCTGEFLRISSNKIIITETILLYKKEVWFRLFYSKNFYAKKGQ